MKNSAKTNGYLTLIEKDEVNGYNVSFPDFPGCFTCGETFEEAEKNAREALGLWIECLQEEKVKVQKPSRVNVPMITFTLPEFA